MTIDSVLLVLSVSHLSLVCIYILVHYKHLFLGQLIILYSVCLMAYLLGTASGEYVDQNISFLILRRFGSACIFIVWLIAHELFIDKKKIHNVIWVLGAAYILLRAIGSFYVIMAQGDSWLVLTMTWGLSQLIGLYFLVHTLYITIFGYETDLVTSRRTDRIVFIAATAIQVLIIFANTSYSIANLIIANFTQASIPGQLIPTSIYSAYTYLFATFFLVWRFRISNPSPTNTSTLFSETSKSVDSGPNKNIADDSLIRVIKESMEVDYLYLRSKLSVQDLANHVNSQEYLVRRTINYHMNYRNFSDFINHYRILDAATRLKNTNEPVSNIGLDVGYTSLSAFHKAFKEKFSITPKEFRIRTELLNFT